MTGLHDLVHRYPSRMVCFNQEERVAGLMSEVCPFLKEVKRRDRGLFRSLVQSKSYLRARTGHKVSKLESNL